MENGTFDARTCEKLKKMLRDNMNNSTGIVLRLAWRAGLKCNEIHDLLWEQVDFENKRLRLPDRTIPMETGLVNALRRWQAKVCSYGPYVTVSEIYRKQMARASISRMMRAAFIRADVSEISLVDLRHDYIRRQYALLSRERAAEVTGVNIFAFRQMRADDARSQACHRRNGVSAQPALSNERAGAECLAMDDASIKRLEDLLSSEPCSSVGVVLRLAWRAGLGRDEIHSLCWENVNFESMRLCLPNRAVPMDDDLARCLRQWKILAEEYGPYLAVSLHTRTHMQPSAISRQARKALDRAGLTKVRLMDLQYNYVLRLSAQEGWQEALRNSGLGIAAFRGKPKYKMARMGGKAREGAPLTMSPSLIESEVVRQRLCAVLDADRDSAAALALWLRWETSLQYTQICDLTWDQVDLATGNIVVNTEKFALTDKLRDALYAVYALRTPNDDPHVLLSPKARTPFSLPRLSNLTQELLVRNGLDITLFQQLCDAEKHENYRRKLIDYVTQHGSISAKECADMLNMAEGAARSLLSQLAASGDLILDNRTYRPADTETTREIRERAIRDYIAAHGRCNSKELSESLGMAPRMIQRTLEPMIRRGEVVKEYAAEKGSILIYSLVDRDNSASHEDL